MYPNGRAGTPAAPESTNAPTKPAAVVMGTATELGKAHVLVAHKPTPGDWTAATDAPLAEVSPQLTLLCSSCRSVQATNAGSCWSWPKSTTTARSRAKTLRIPVDDTPQS